MVNHSEKHSNYLLGILLKPLFLCLFFIGLSSHTWAQVVFEQKSNPAGLFTTSTVTKYLDESISTIVPAPSVNGYSFTHWTINGVRDNAPDGQAKNKVTFTIVEHTAAIAHYLPNTEDSDGDGVPDWFEIRMFDSLQYNSDYDGDGDGISLGNEQKFGLTSTIADEFRQGGASIRRSSMVFANFGGAKKLSVSSDPAGLFATSVTYPETDTSYTTSNLSGSNNGYFFSHWEINGVRQADGQGLALSRVTMVMNEDKIVVAKYYPQNEDTDADGLPDWFEWH